MTADQVEANGEWFGDAQPGEVIDLRPAREDELCTRCRHPRWMHTGQVDPHGRPRNARCHHASWWGKNPNQCSCMKFGEMTYGREQA